MKTSSYGNESKTVKVLFQNILVAVEAATEASAARM